MDYKFRHLSNNSELEQLSDFFNSVFNSKIEGALAKRATLEMPGLNIKDWYIQEYDKKIVSAIAKVEWNIFIDNIKLIVWEQAFVGTHEKHRGKKLISNLNNILDKDAKNAEVDFIMIQGIPDFYSKFGYRYAIEFENHLNLPLKCINDVDDKDYKIKKGSINDYPTYVNQEDLVKNNYYIKSQRSKDVWSYQLSHNNDVPYSSEVWFIDNYFVKISRDGFGDGLIISEISENIPSSHFYVMLSFLKKIAIERGKPYLRFNIQHNSSPAKMVLKKGANFDKTYGWQVKIINIVKFLNKIKPILQGRINDSEFKNLSDFFYIIISGKYIYFTFNDGLITNISNEEPQDGNLGVHLPNDCIEPLILGFRSWKEIQYCRCDLYSFNPSSEKLVETLFPKKNSWINSIW